MVIISREMPGMYCRTQVLAAGALRCASSQPLCCTGLASEEEGSIGKPYPLVAGTVPFPWSGDWVPDPAVDTLERTVLGLWVLHGLCGR